MDKQYIERHLVIDRYLQNALDGRELDEFEERLSWDSDLVDELEMASALRDGLRAELADSNYQVIAPVPMRERVMRILWQPQYAAAASFLVGVTVSTLLLSTASGPDTAFPGPAVKTEIVHLDVLRGSGGPTVVIKPDAWTVFSVVVPDESSIYRATITTGEIPWETVTIQPDLAPSYAGSVAIGMPGRILKAGPLLLTLERRRDAAAEVSYELVQQIPFDVVFAE